MSNQVLDLLVGQFFSIKVGEHAGSVGVLRKSENRYFLDIGDNTEVDILSKEELLPYTLS